ncbi:hypothetical protein AB0E62_38655 [Streptomyces sp. NPDC038707]|uniref:hypothetical protein n=1 Tax=Streptomyces sp. NPDC038707 TaxID=3154329 RepID=UPI00340B153B
MHEIPDELIGPERSAEQERVRLAGLTGGDYDARLRRWRKASAAFQAAVTEHATAIKTSRYELEQAVKKAVRHPEPEDGAANKYPRGRCRDYRWSSQSASTAPVSSSRRVTRVPGLPPRSTIQRRNLSRAVSSRPHQPCCTGRPSMVSSRW